ncbi:DUF397 domain-containing protein [Amycolatopsis anabasis]|uniref:DUF397 domain-containing protein n=1 Tax=Amycolatopsis anabasis TaxID=1840409 RepID=UPI00131AD498|nr:DUF397 domain-containing protein [Amycolatopsis anabasis]
MEWRKSSYSTNNGDCVEVAMPLPAVHVRDSKNPSSGELSFPAPSWQAFVCEVGSARRGR